jgi:acyl-CoA thioester hydrolase
LGDDLIVVTELEEIRAASVLIHQQVRRDRELLADAMVTAAFISPEGRPKRQPREWVERFERLRTEGKK